jgi:hypothetical protein
VNHSVRFMAFLGIAYSLFGVSLFFMCYLLSSPEVAQAVAQLVSCMEANPPMGGALLLRVST